MSELSTVTSETMAATVPSASAKRYRTAVYLRLSKDDGDKAESDSISNQRKLILDYVKSHPEFCVVDEYVDDGWSGANFDRPSFQRLYEDLQSGAVNCVLVKDLSRFGRNYIEVGRYLERIFPLLGVRLVAINDNYDTASEWNNSDAIIVPIKNLVNDAYCRDMSVKVKTQLEAKRRRGECVSNFAPYGYKKDPKDKNKLLVDEDSASVVTQIFRWKQEGYSDKRIADKLNDLGTPTPLEYRRQNGQNVSDSFKKNDEAVWNCGIVYRILHNEAYTGYMVQGKWKKLDYRSKERSRLPEDMWTRVEGTHEAIIDKEQFEIVKMLMGRDARKPDNDDMIIPIAGFVFCGVCGRQMIIHPTYYRGKRTDYYVCKHCKREGRKNKYTRLDVIYRILYKGINEQIASAQQIKSVLDEAENLPLYKRQVVLLDGQITQLKEESERFFKLKKGLYEDYTNGILEREEYLEYSDLYKAKIESRTAKVRELLAQREQLLSDPEDITWIEDIRKYKGFTELTRAMVAELLDRVTVYSDGRVEVTYRYGEKIEDMMKTIEEMKNRAESEPTELEPGDGEPPTETTEQFNTDNCETIETSNPVSA